MMSLLYILAIVELCLPGPFAVPYPRVVQPPDYYPIRSGNKWVYTSPTGKSTRIVSNVVKLFGVSRITLSTVEGSILPNSVVFIGTDAGLFRFTGVGQKPEKPICLLRLPLRPGDRWENDFTLGLFKVVTKSKALEPEWVNVPAGRFKAIIIIKEIAVTDPVDLSEKTDFVEESYAPGVGLIRRKINRDGAVVFTEVLESFVPGPPGTK